MAAARTSLLVLALFALTLAAGGACNAQTSAPATQEQAAGGAAAQTRYSDVLTFPRPQFGHRQRVQLRRLAVKIKPSAKNAFVLEQVVVDAYVSPNATDFEKAAASTLSNDTHRRLVKLGVPRDRIAHASQGIERPQTARGTWQIEVVATGARR